MRGWSLLPTPGVFTSTVGAPNSLSYTRRQSALPSSQVTPMNTCPGLRPRWYPEYSPYRIQDCCLPYHSTPSAFTLSIPREAILMTTTIHISGLNSEPAPLIHPASDSRYRAYPRTSLLTCWLSSSQVGLGPCRLSPTG